MTRPRHDESLTALDELVLAELDSLTVRRLPPRPTAAVATDWAGVSEIDTRPAHIAPLRRVEGSKAGLSGEEAEGLFDEPLAETDGLAAEESDAAAAASLLTPEEEAFITRAVGFLRQREHADMILGRVWEQLTGDDPSAFFEPPADALPEAPSDGAGSAGPLTTAAQG